MTFNRPKPTAAAAGIAAAYIPDHDISNVQLPIHSPLTHISVMGPIPGTRDEYGRGVTSWIATQLITPRPI